MDLFDFDDFMLESPPYYCNNCEHSFLDDGVWYCNDMGNKKIGKCEEGMIKSPEWCPIR